MTDQNEKEKRTNRVSMIEYQHEDFSKIILSKLSSNNNRKTLKNYTQSEVREFVEDYKKEINQERLVEISQTLYAKSPQYRRLVNYFGGMALFSHIIKPIKNLRDINKDKVLEQYNDVGELLSLLNLKHEMKKVMITAFIEDVFYGYVHRTKDDFYIQSINHEIAKISSIENGVFNFKIDMSYFKKNESELPDWPEEIQIKYEIWKRTKEKNRKIDDWVELDAENTICIKINEEMTETFPPFAGSFEDIFDINGFKKLRKDREEIGNYMILTQELPMRKDSEDNNDFLIDKDMMTYFHNMASDVVPENVGVITSPMKIEPLKFEKDRADNDGVAKAERDFWSGNGTSQLLFNADKSTSQGLLKSIKTDEEVVFGVLAQIETWINRYLKFNFKNLFFNVEILNITYFNQEEKQKMYLESAQYGIPVKSHVSASVGLNPLEMVGLAYLENDLLKLHEEFLPLMSSHTMGKDALDPDSKGRPEADADELGDEGQASRDKD